MILNVGGVTEAGKSKKNETGNWRYLIPIINEESCNGCGLCEIFCPDSCIRIENGVAIVDALYCKGCGICAKECHRLSIIMQAEGEMTNG